MNPGVNIYQLIIEHDFCGDTENGFYDEEETIGYFSSLTKAQDAARTKDEKTSVFGRRATWSWETDRDGERTCNGYRIRAYVLDEALEFGHRARVRD